MAEEEDSPELQVARLFRLAGHERGDATCFFVRLVAWRDIG
jgi:hypothetical protein